MITVLIVDDHKVVRAGLRVMVNLQPDMKVIAEAADGETAVRLYREHRPDVVTMDLKLPGKFGGWQAISAIRSAFPQAKILVLTTLIGDEHIYRALQSGALGYVLKEADESELIAAIRSTNAGLRTMPAAVVAVLEQRLAFDPLSAREIDVLRHVAKGRSNREVGEALGIAEVTVKGYLRSISSKLDAPDRTAAVMIAVQRGLIALE
jgi:DNA-binding NarL/FixJ family response regulator